MFVTKHALSHTRRIFVVDARKSHLKVKRQQQHLKEKKKNNIKEFQS